MKAITEGKGWNRVPSHWPMLLATLLCACCWQSVCAENLKGDSVVKLPIIDAQDLAFRHLTIEDGLSHSIVKQIVQDDQGFLWFGTQGGLNRYDGYRFKVYKHDPKNPNGLSGIFIRSLFKDRAGMLWIGVDQFLDRFDPATEIFTHYPAGSTVVHISQDRAGILWLATNNGLDRLDPATGPIIKYQHDPNDPTSLSSNEVLSSGEDNAGTLWVATNLGLDAFDRRTGKVRTHVPLLQPSDVFFHEDRFGVFWIIYPNGSGLAVLDRKTNKLTRYQLYDREPPSTSAAGMATILEDRDGTLWFGTHGNGLLQLDPDRRRFIRYRNSPGDPISLAENSQLALFEDREGNVWVAVPGAGIDRFVKKPLRFERFRHEPSNPNSLDRAEVNGIYEDRQGILWIGTEGGLNRIDRKTGQHKLYRDAGQASVITITGDGLDNLWAGAYGSGLKHFDPRTGQFKAYRHDPADPHSLSNDIVTRVFIDHAGTLWAGTDDGLNRFDAVKRNFTVYKLDPQNPSRQSYLSIAEDPEGDLWLGCQYSGLQRFDPATGKFTVYQNNPAVPGSLSNNRVLSVYFDHSGTLWAGTQNGLDRFDPITQTFTAYYDRDGLPDSSVNAILEDGRGDLWLSTNKGLSKFSPATKTFKNYSAADGLSGDEFHLWGAAFKSQSGEMFFGGPAGATAFYPDRIVENTYVPPVVLTEFRLFGNPVSIGGKSPLQKSIGYTDSLSLSYWQNIFSLEFSALSYLNPATNRYRYKLEGLEKDWNEPASSNRSVTYTTLPPGNYTLRVQGATNRGPWNESGVALRIAVLPPWWDTWSFRLLAAVLFLASLGYAHHYRLQNIEQQFNMRLEERVGERTRIARELHDTLLQSFQGLMLRFQVVNDLLPPGKAKETLDGALERADQAIVEGRDAVHDLRSSTTVSSNLADSLAALGEELASQDSAAFRLVVEGGSRNLHPILQDEVYRIAREALRNSFSHARARKIEVEVQYGERLLRLRIRDDGDGIAPEILEEGRRGHYGLHGIRERAKQIGAKLDIWSGAGSGTEIDLSIPSSIAYTTSPGRSGFRLFRKNGMSS
jgi:ligand-binding sensor domain-containing protein/signal transduction histidine kinase